MSPLFLVLLTLCLICKRAAARNTHYKHVLNRLDKLVVDLPKCSEPCFERGVARVCSSFSDFNCQCNPNNFPKIKSGLNGCISKRCNTTIDPTHVEATYLEVCDLNNYLRASGYTSIPASSKPTDTASGEMNQKSNPTSDGFSTGSKVAVGIGAAVFAAVVFASFAFILIRHRKQRSNLDPSKRSRFLYKKAELDAEQSKSKSAVGALPSELSSDESSAELPAEKQLAHELPTPLPIFELGEGLSPERCDFALKKLQPD